MNIYTVHFTVSYGEYMAMVVATSEAEVCAEFARRYELVLDGDDTGYQFVGPNKVRRSINHQCLEPGAIVAIYCISQAPTELAAGIIDIGGAAE